MKTLFFFSPNSKTSCRFIYQQEGVKPKNEKEPSTKDKKQEVITKTEREKQDLKHELFMRDWMKNAWMKEQSWKVFEHSKELKHEPWARDLFIKKTHQDNGAWNAFEHIKKYQDMPWAEDVLIEAINVDCWAAFKYLKKYEKLPYGNKVLQYAKSRDVLTKAVLRRDQLKPFEYFKYYKDVPWAKEILLLKATIKGDHWLAFEYFEYYKDMTWAGDILIKAIETPQSCGSFLAFKYFEKYKKMLYANEVLQKAKSKENLLKSAEKNPEDVFVYLEWYKDLPYVGDVLMKTIAVTNGFVFGYLKKYKNLPSAGDVLIKAIETPQCSGPFLAFKTFEEWKDMPWAGKVLVKIAKVDPWTALEHFKIYKNGPYVKDILIKARETIEKDGEFFKAVLVINNLHEESNDIRFFVIENFTPSQLYWCITTERSEVFTSSYNAIIKRLLEKMKTEGTNLYEVMKKNQFEGIAPFLEASVAYGRWQELMDTVPSEVQKKEILQKLINSVKGGQMQNAVALGEILRDLNDDQLLSYLEEQMELEEKQSTESEKVLWNLLGRVCHGKTKNNWIQNIPETYKLPDLGHKEKKELFDAQGRCVQRYYFYNDEDGKESFESFLKFYKTSPDWEISEKKSIITIISKNKNGKSIIIYANKPEAAEENEDIDVKLKEKGIIPQVLVHRGHSYHTEKSLERLNGSERLVFLGSCGGYQNLEKVLSKSPNAHIIATKGTGIMTVNDPLLKIINEEILSGESPVLKWQTVWEKAEQTIKNLDDFKNYVRPDENFGAMLITKYQEMTKK